MMTMKLAQRKDLEEGKPMWSQYKAPGGRHRSRVNQIPIDGAQALMFTLINADPSPILEVRNINRLTALLCNFVLRKNLG